MLALLLAAAFAGPRLPVDYQDEVREASAFLAQDKLDAAEWHSEQAVRHPDGKIAPDAWLLLCDVRIQQADHQGATYAASQALTWSRTEAQAEQAQSRIDQLATGFGTVSLLGPSSDLSKRVHIELVDTIEDPTHTAWFSQVRRRLARWP